MSHDEVEIDYTNWRNERAVRRVIPDRLQWTANKWHPEPQWLLRAWDVEKREFRDFALAGIHAWRTLPGERVLYVDD